MQRVRLAPIMLHNDEEKQVFCQFNELMQISELKKKINPKNRNKHPKHQIERLSKILKQNGVRHPIVISDRSGLITKGHGRLEAAIFLGWKSFPVQFQAYESEEKEFADAVADNAIASWAELDLDGIKIDLKDFPKMDVDLLGIENFEISNESIGLTDPDKIPEVKQTICKTGDLWILGNHRLLCGDATKKEDVKRLMAGEKADMVYTDPPYGMRLDTDWSPELKGVKGVGHSKMGMTGRKYSEVIGDSEDYDPNFILNYFKDVKEVFLWGGDYYCQHLPKEGSWVVWDKRTRADGESIKQIMGSEFELCWSKQKHARQIARILWAGICQGPKEGARVHPTQKPAALHEWFFERWGKDKTNIVDLYLGSGSTLIACEKTNRRCFGMEIDPYYCDVIIKRWEQFTGQKAVRA